MRATTLLMRKLRPAKGSPCLDSLPDERQNQEELLGEHQEAAILQREVGKALEKLNEKERYIIEQRVAADDPRTLQEIAEHFSISRERVRQIEEGARKKLKNPAGTDRSECRCRVTGSGKATDRGERNLSPFYYRIPLHIHLEKKHLNADKN